MSQPPDSYGIGPRSGPHHELLHHSMCDLATLVRTGELSSTDLANACIERAQAAEDSGVSAFITLAAEHAQRRARILDDLLVRHGPQGLLHGIPFSVKDVFPTEGIRTTAGMRLLENWIPDDDAALVHQVKGAGGVLLGKNNMHEYSYGITADNPHFGAVRNPYDQARMAGGSSGGSGAAVGLRLSPAALATDTGGSARIPAALCGVVGLRPTCGRLSSQGILCASMSWDSPGPLAQDVRDTALMMHALDDSMPAPDALPRDAEALAGVRVGIPVGAYWSDNHPEVERLFKHAQHRLITAGAELCEVAVPHAELGNEVGFLVAVPEVVPLLDRLLHERGMAAAAEHLDQFGADFAAILGGQVGPNAAPIPAHTYIDARTRMTPMVRSGFLHSLSTVDVLLTPTTPAPAIPVSESRVMRHNGRQADPFDTFVRYTFGVSVAGLPALSVPAGMTDGGLPVGVQLIGPDHAEPTLLRLGRAFELAA